MSARSLAELTAYLDAYLRIGDVPDYPPALNGLQLSHQGPVRHIAAAVDVSERTIDGAIACGANLLIVHHGMFWGGPERIAGRAYDRLRRLITNDVAVYSAHLPLDAHDTHGNSRLLALRLGLQPVNGFAPYQRVFCGVRGEDHIATATLHDRLRAFSKEHGGDALATPFEASRVTKRWAICSGSGVDRAAFDETQALHIDTLIVGEGPHWTAVEAENRGIVVMYGGHYATETLGVCSVAAHLETQFGIPWTFVPAPTGL